MVDGVAVEIFPPAVYEADVYGPVGPNGEPPERVHAAGDEIPIEARFHPDFVAGLVDYDVSNPPPGPEMPPPAPIVPAFVSARQARLALLAAGKLSDVADAIAALPSGQNQAAQIEWEYAARVDRHSPLVEMLGASLGLDLDALFLEAMAL
jgi:hypothetical protein